MDRPKIVTNQEWSAARVELLAKEQELAAAQDRLAAERRRLPMVKITKDYRFGGPRGSVGLTDLFQGRRQLLVYHFWFQPGETPCEGCSLWVRNLGHLPGLHQQDTSLVLVSRASPAEIEAVQEQRGWTVPWFSAVGEDFNTDAGYAGEAQITVLLRDADTAYRTYTTSGPVLETLGNHWTLLELTPRGKG
jgi:predicted dithiol-disulfide oxidoreductase (DUF899 family)